jgi:type IV secretory pathway VirB2 component (pilin)
MNTKKIFVYVLLILGLFTAVYAAGDCDGLAEINKTINKIINLVVYVGGGLATLAATVVGIMMFNAEDPAQKDHLKERLKYIVIGLVIIVVAPMVVKYILGTPTCTP